MILPTLKNFGFTGNLEGAVFILFSTFSLINEIAAPVVLPWKDSMARNDMANVTKITVIVLSFPVK
jgi:hypothetical protein